MLNPLKYAFITGSAGLIGSQACKFFHEKGYTIIGIDNDKRSYFFGKEASTKKSRETLIKTIGHYKEHCGETVFSSDYIHYSIDVSNYAKLEEKFKDYADKIEIVIHTAAQPSHDWAAKEPLTDFRINALGTMNLLEMTRLYCPNATFIFTSTNKVYGDRPNYLKYKELPLRWEVDASNEDLTLFSGVSLDYKVKFNEDKTKHQDFMRLL